MDPDIAIKVEHAGKVFKLPYEKTGSLKAAFVNFYRRKRGYELQKALNDISFEVKKGEFFGIVGRNGSGKSTLLKLLAGIYNPSSGNVQVNGSLTPFIELGVGFNMELTGRENVFLNGALLGFNRKSMRAMYKDIVEFAEIGKFMDQKLKNYSSGMQVRLAFSIAIRADTDILILDEVLAVGDAAFQRKCFDYFDELKKNNKTVVLVTHDMGSVERYCDRAILIEKGKMLDGGNAREIASQYRLLNLAEKPTTSEDTKLNGLAKISSVKINGSQEATVNENENIEIEVDYSTSVERKCIVAISIYRDDGVHIVYYDNRDTDLTLSKKKQDYKVTCSFSADQFLNGAYKVDIEIYDKERGYLDNKINAVRFAITNYIPSKTGTFNIKANWRVLGN